MTSILESISPPTNEKLYPKFNWDIIRSCEDPYLKECAKFMCRFIPKFNGAANSFYKTITQERQLNEKFSKLSEQCKILENCQNCVQLQEKLDDQISKMRKLAEVFGQISSDDAGRSRCKLEKVQDMFTQMVDDGIPKSKHLNQHDIVYGKRRREISENQNDDLVNQNENVGKDKTFCHVTPKKKKHVENLLKNVGEMEGESELSPILRKSKSRGRLDDSKLPLANLSNRLDISDTFVSSPKKKISPKEESTAIVNECSPSLLGNALEEEKMSSPVTKRIPLDPIVLVVKSEQEEKKHDSLSLLRKKAPRRSKEEFIRQLKNSCNKNLKQARLSFSNMKVKEPADFSLQDSFCGGLRTFSNDAATNKNEEEEMLKVAVQLSLNESLKNKVTEDDDVINASPSNEQKPLQKRKHKKHRKQITSNNENAVSIVITDDDDTTIFASPHKKRQSSSPSKKNARTNDKSPVNLNETSFSLLGNIKQDTSSPLKKIKRDPSPNIVPHIYKEPVVRKRAEKMSLPGWSCKKCKDFYEVAFKGDENLIREKMNECSKHRGKFNPERAETPAGFWDLRMPPTQDTEAFNKMNNRD